MRPLKLRINLRHRQLRQWRFTAFALSVTSCGILGLAANLGHEATVSRVATSGAETALARISAEVEMLQKVRGQSTVDEDHVAWLMDILPRLDLPRGPSSAEVLYELEKQMPDGIHLSVFEYNADGLIEFKAIAGSRAELAELMSQLQSGSFFRSIQVGSQQESAPGKFEALVKLKVL